MKDCNLTNRLGQPSAEAADALERGLREDLHEIARRENLSLHDIHAIIMAQKPGGTSMLSAARVFIMGYWHAAAVPQIRH